jgi:phage/plasmid-like protein (TIGR03299 family)
MAHGIETTAWKGEKPWHGLGVEVTQDLSPAEMMQAAGLDWTVSKRKVYFAESGDDKAKHKAFPGKFVLTRDSDNQPLDVVGETYKPVQNADAFEFFKKFTDAGHMTMETAGSLWTGRYVWALARLGKDFKLGKNDEVRGFLLLSQPHVHGKAMLMQFTAIRVVCWNTLTFAIGADLRGKGSAFRMPHSTKFDESVKMAAEEALGISHKQMDTFKDAATLLSKKKIGDEAVKEYFTEVLQYKPVDPNKAKKLNKKGEEQEARTPRLLPKFLEALETSPGAAMVTAKGTLWGAVNAVTFTIDHEDGRERSTALRNAWLGHKANIKRRALDLALDRAKAA